MLIENELSHELQPSTREHTRFQQNTSRDAIVSLSLFFSMGVNHRNYGLNYDRRMMTSWIEALVATCLVKLLAFDPHSPGYTLLSYAFVLSGHLTPEASCSAKYLFI